MTSPLPPNVLGAPSIDTVAERSGRCVDVCYSCGAHAERFCDFVVDADTRKTCDRACCAAHSVNRGLAMYQTEHGRRCREVDYCEEHARVKQ